MIEPSSYTFKSAIRAIRQHTRGCIIESFIRVEYGEQYLHAAWDAFSDIDEHHQNSYETEVTMLNQFILMLEEEVCLENMGIPAFL
jgi:hypothetical protein